LKEYIQDQENDTAAALIYIKKGKMKKSVKGGMSQFHVILGERRQSPITAGALTTAE